MFEALETADLCPKLLPHLQIFERHFKSRLSASQHLRRERDRGLRIKLVQSVRALALMADKVLFRNHYIVKLDVCRAASVKEQVIFDSNALGFCVYHDDA